MNRLLRLYLPDAWPAHTAVCEWQLCDEAGGQLQFGNSEPRHWPEAERCEAILGASQCLVLKAQLPRGVRARNAEVLAYALEEQLVGDTDDEHFVIGEASRGRAAETGDDAASTPVWVISRARMKSVLGALQSLGRAPQRVISEIQLAPRRTGWSVCLHGPQARSGFARLAAEDGFAFDLSNIAAPPFELQRAVDAARSQGHPPSAIDVHGAGDFDAAAAAAWQDALGVPVHVAGAYDWRACPARDARNLLAGEFAPPRAAGQIWGAFRPALALAALCLAVYAIFSFGEWIWLDHQRARLQAEIAAGFRAVAPQQPIQDPVLQMQRLYDRLRHERGQMGSADFLPLLAAATGISMDPGALRSISYEEGRLEFSMQMKSAADAERLRETLTHRGFVVVLRDTHAAPGGAGVEAQFAVRSAT